MERSLKKRVRERKRGRGRKTEKIERKGGRGTDRNRRDRRVRGDGFPVVSSFNENMCFAK